MRLLHGRGPRLSACVGVLALVVSGCSSTSTPSKSAATVTGSTLHVLAARPQGADRVSTDVLDAEQLALKSAPGGKVGPFTVRLQFVHGNEVSASARAAVKDKLAIAYLGEIAPGTSGVSLQITNQVGLLQLSPSDTAIYLTQATPAVSDSPNHYYPANGTYHHTFARVVPNTAAEAKALVRDMQALHVSRLYVSPGDGSAYATSLSDEVRQDARAQGLTLASAAADANGVFYAALDGPGAASALDRLAGSSPGAKLFAPSALYDDTLVSKLSPAAQRNLYVSSPGVPVAAQSAAAKTFTSDFQSTYHRAPQPQAIYGYETMRALLAVLKSLGGKANSRAEVVAAFRGLRNPPNSVLGPYSLTSGDTNLGASSFVIAHPAGGRLVPRNQP